MKRVQNLVGSIADCGVGYQRAEYQMALTIALASYMRDSFPNDLEDVLKLHVINLQALLEELDAKGALDIGSVSILSS